MVACEANKAGRCDSDGKPIYLPEDRMRDNMWIALFIYPDSLVWYGWTAQYGIYWLVPAIASFFFGIGSMLVFGCVTMMLTEFTPGKSSVGVAANNLIRNIVSCVAEVAAQSMMNGLTTGWAFTMVGLWCFAASGLPNLAMRKWATECSAYSVRYPRSHWSLRASRDCAWVDLESLLALIRKTMP